MPSSENDYLTHPTVSCEYVEATTLGIDPTMRYLPGLISFCQRTLADMAPDPDAVLLVITGDFVHSVTKRLPTETDETGLSEERGAGRVAGKTMEVDDEIHVLIPTWHFPDPLEVESQKDVSDRERIARRTILHEAQHVVMMQAGEDFKDFSSEPWARGHFLSGAHQILAEYRAELAVPRSLWEESDWDFPADSLKALQDGLRACEDSYCLSGDLDALSQKVYQQALHLWKRFAYLAAARRIAEISTPPDASTKRLWASMGSEHWGPFEDLLGQVASAQTRVPQIELEHTADKLADLLQKWLVSLGYRWQDTARGAWFEPVKEHPLRSGESSQLRAGDLLTRFIEGSKNIATRTAPRR